MINQVLFYVNSLLLIGVIWLGLHQLRRDRTSRAVLRLIGLIAAIWFLAVYIHEGFAGYRLSTDFVRPGLTLMFSYLLAERLYEHFAR